MSRPPARPLAQPAAPVRRRGRRTALVAAVLIVLACAIWSALWFVAAGRVEARLDEGIAREARVGRVFTCAERRISGFPFKISLDCGSPRLTASRPGGTLVAGAARLTAMARVDAPNRIVAELVGPLSVEAPGLPGGEATWRGFRADIVTSGGLLDHGEIVVEAPNLRLRGGQTMYVSSADRLDLNASRDQGRPAVDDALRVTASLDGVVSEFLDGLIGNPSPGNVAIDISISRIDALRPSAQAPPFPPMERWRQAGGAVHVARASGVKGPFKVGFTGDLAIDAAHRLAGHLDASIEGAQPLMARLPVPAMAGNLLKMSAGSLTLPLVMANGRVSVGPFAVARLLPLY